MQFKKILLRLYSRFFARPSLYGFNRFLYDLSLRGLGIYGNNSSEEYFYTNQLPGIIKNRNPVIFDVGANVGGKTLLLSKRFPSSSIYCFEPNPKCFEKLNNIKNENIKTYSTALGNEIKKITLYDRKGFGITQHSSFYKDVITEHHRSELIEYEVDVTTLDEFCVQENIDFIDFIKIDAEGNDYNVLLGAKNLLKNSSIRCIQFEFSNHDVISRVFFRDFILLLSSYKIFRMLPTGLIRLNSRPIYTEIYGFQNIVAVLKESVSGK